jgi:hypothetical protein
MKARFIEIGSATWYTIIAVVVIAVLSLGGLAIQGVVYPWWLSIQRESVESSKSFTDANNNMLQTYKLEYARLETKAVEAGNDTASVSAYRAQQSAVVEKMCTMISTMKIETVNPSILTWLNSKGGCQ